MKNIIIIKVIPRILGKTLDNILNPFGEIVVQRVAKNLSKRRSRKDSCAFLIILVSKERNINTMFLKKPSQQMKFSFLIWIFMLIN